ncbi:MAG: regulatory iron-sulfur-containing complex subunit RicT [Gemmatimonadota bacterium]|nr:regulatory iron-sulfur-containing complex subunit RicT [Gemmatimonadota bacterium]
MSDSSSDDRRDRGEGREGGDERSRLDRPRPVSPRRPPRPSRADAPGPPRPVPAKPAAGGAPGSAAPRGAPAAPRTGATQILEVRFKGLRSDYFTFSHPVPLREREYVVVEADRGRDIGVVRRAVNAEDLACEGGCDAVGGRSVPTPEKRIIRRAAPADVNRLLQLREQEMEVRRRTRELVARHRLRMKVSEAEWQWDRNKLTVYFTAEKRVDFRALVRDMARAFRTRIELRQIGVRDEARRLGGLGRCRRELCCRAWLPSIEPVTLQLAKDQGLSLNPSQISGACGRLMNCLRYEHAMYMQAKKRFPAVGRTVTTGNGEERVTAWSLFDETVSLQGRDGRRTIPLVQLKDETRAAKRSALGGESAASAAEPTVEDAPQGDG